MYNPLQGLARIESMDPKRQAPFANLRDYLLIKDAAAFLGVSAATLRNWERTGKIAVRRHPINGYRLFEKADLEEILTRARESGSFYGHGVMLRPSAHQEDQETQDE